MGVNLISSGLAEKMISMFQKSITQFLKLFIPIVLLFPPGAFADHEILYTGLHGNKAWLRINGRPGALGKGQSRSGVKVLSVKKNEVIIKVHGKRYLYKKKSKTGKKLDDEIKIPFNSEHSSYFVRGHINGKSFAFVVDTGASKVALNLNDAKRLKLSLKRDDRTKIRLAGGKLADGWVTTLRSVKVGDIEIKNVSALIIKERGPAIALLGMSFLSQLEISQSDDTMVLKYTPP